MRPYFYAVSSLWVDDFVSKDRRINACPLAKRKTEVHVMSQIQVNNLSFYYEESGDDIFKNVSFSIDTSWKLGFVGRNGRGKTTFLNLLLGKYEYEGSIISQEVFEYFPYTVQNKEKNTIDVAEDIYPEYELWKLLRELNLLEVPAEVLYRPFKTLSNGEQTKVMLAVLFLKEHHFLLIDEPTNHLDVMARQAVSRYLNKKTGFILVSHDRVFLDACIDHVLALNKNTIEVVQGNFSTWWENKRQKDESEIQENEKLKKEVGRLQETVKQASNWSDTLEKTKFGTRIGGLKPDRGAIGHKAAKMMKRAKSAEKRMEKAVTDKASLLKDLETAEDLKIIPASHHKEVLVSMEDVTLVYGGNEQTDGEKTAGENAADGNAADGNAVGKKVVCEHLSFEVRQGERVALEGSNGCGKSTIIKAVSGVGIPDCEKPRVVCGRIEIASGLVISYVSQDTSWLCGGLSDFIAAYGLNDTLFRAVLRKLDFSREQFDKELQYYSEGQKKKVLLAKSLCEQAHLYIWDEPLNFIDVFSRMQIEELIKKYRLTMIFVEHDIAFTEKIATKRIQLYLKE